MPAPLNATVLWPDFVDSNEVSQGPSSRLSHTCILPIAKLHSKHPEPNKVACKHRDKRGQFPYNIGS
jgi:hypothetical protein